MGSSPAPRYAVSFELKRASGAVRGSILACVTHGGQRVRFSIGHSRIEAVKWDASKQRVKGYTRWANDANERIAEIQRTVDMWFEQESRRPLEELKSTITGKPIRVDSTGTSASRKEQTAGIVALFKDYIKDRTKTGRRSISDSTKKGFETAMRAFEQFEIGTKQTLTAASFAANTKQQLLRAKELEESISEWLTTQHVRKDTNKGELGVNDNTRNRFMRQLTTVLKWADEQGLAGANKLHTRFTNDRADPEGQVALTETDIKAIEALTLVEKSQLWHARNLFLLGVRTGQRFSDWYKINPSRWNEAQQTIPTTKTGGVSTIVHTEPVRKILRRYEKTGLPTYAQPVYNAKVNVWIKELCQMAGLDRPTDKITSRNDSKHVETVPLYTLVTTHTARRTFVTLARLQGLSDVLISKQTGHENLASLKTYDRTTPDDLAKALGVTAVRRKP